MTANRRTIIAGGVAFGLAGGLAGAAGARQAPPPVRPDLYSGELDYLALQWTGRREDIPAHIRIAARSEPGEPMSITGRVLSWQTSEPVADVVVYVYHTDAKGSYKGGPAGTRHARLRGWMRTGTDGVYAFDSTRPTLYARGGPAHVHMTVVEPGRKPYCIDEIVFTDDLHTDAAYRSKMTDRGGNGIISLKRASGVWVGQRDIRLERHPA
jgi:protocatechuate 3,4-dioxygenase beta subunit